MQSPNQTGMRDAQVFQFFCLKNKELSFALNQWMADLVYKGQCFFYLSIFLIEEIFPFCIHARVPSGDGFPSGKSNKPLYNAMNNQNFYQ